MCWKLVRNKTTKEWQKGKNKGNKNSMKKHKLEGAVGKKKKKKNNSWNGERINKGTKKKARLP